MAGRIHKAIVLAGGAGSRLHPATACVCKQLLPVYDKPMVYYPIAALMSCGARKLCLVASPHDLPRFWRLLGDGGQWGITIEYRMQPRPEGVAQALVIAASFIGSDPVALALGDNVFCGPEEPLQRAFDGFVSGALVFACMVADPGRYGVVEFDTAGRAAAIVEKPAKPPSPFAVPGLYLYDNDAPGVASKLKPSARGELEITDVHSDYLRRGCLSVRRLPDGFAWFDAGDADGLHEASACVRAVQRRTGVVIGSPDLAALRRGWITRGDFEARLAAMPDSVYRRGLEHVISARAPESADRAWSVR